MEFRTVVEIEQAGFEIQPCEPLLLVGSCFADEIGKHFEEEGFPTTVNPYGTMYNPVSVLHTLQRWLPSEQEQGHVLPRVVFLTLGTNHVYRLKSTGEIVDNCEKRPQNLFQEEELTVEECCDALQQTIYLLRQYRSDVQVVVTVSPIRYRKYGYHGSQVSKATLLLAVSQLSTIGARISSFDSRLSSLDSQPLSLASSLTSLHYFPAYEIFMDELRDYRFYAADMLHPSKQAVDYVWERLVDSYFSKKAKNFLDEWRPLKQVLAHRPYNPEAPEYKALMDKTMLKVEELRKKYPTFAR